MRATHAGFNSAFVYSALALALVPGFGLAVGLAMHLAFGWSLGRWWPVVVQIHGHAQVFGWLALFIMGVSLFFLPRFSGVPLRFPSLPRWICALLVLGILSRSIALFWFNAASAPAARGLFGFSALLEIAAIWLYVALIYLSIRRAESRHKAIRAVRPYLAGALLGWVLCGAVVGISAVLAAWSTGALFDQGWNLLGIDFFTGLVLLPVAFAFSIRTFPLYLRLPAARWPVRLFAMLYFAAFALEIIPVAVGLVDFPLGVRLQTVHALGRLCKGVLLLALIWHLDLLTRSKSPWTAGREGDPPAVPRLHPVPRSHFPDYGEFGHFEWPVYMAYIWLLAAGLCEIYSAVALLSGAFIAFDASVLRHMYLGGFGTLLLLGMAPRMVPGFLGIRHLAYPRLVALSFYLGGSAMLFRVLPYLLSFAPTALPSRLATHLFGLSGVLGFLAVAVLAVNLWTSMHRPRGLKTSD
ncbi:MAG TPA: hypothetical protein EYG11_23845 [Candidatus Latescibacteria bacterium]|nr:hypothetical protein [Candidatus Latescibacterota bacterium]